MCAGKSDLLIKIYLQHKKRGMRPLLFTHYLDTRFVRGHVMSRVGIRERSFAIDDDLNIYEFVLYYIRFYLNPRLVLIDEVQFLKIYHIIQMLCVVKMFSINVFCFGICTDFLGVFFLSSSTMLIIADYNVVLSVDCFCGRKAIMNMRIDKKGKKVTTGEIILIGGAGLYTQVCKYHFG